MSALAAAVALMLSLAAPSAYAIPDHKPDGVTMFGDALVARPVGAVMTVLGTAAFLVTLPLSLAGGNVGQAADKLVVSPARETFVRCLGCTKSGRYRKQRN